MLIELLGIRKYYKTGKHMVRALDGIDLKAEKGEFLAIRGKSGCGKSTLLHVLGGLTGINGGEYRYDGEILNFQNKSMLADFRRKNIGFIVQDFALIGEKTVYENIELPLGLRKLPKSKKRELVYQYLEMVGLPDKINRYPDELSGGEQQRVAIARALIGNPRVLLADEPTGSLDEENQDNILDIIKKVTENGTAVVLATHDREIAEKCDRCIRISNGKIQE